MQKCQPQSSQVPTCTSAPPLCRGKGHPWPWQCPYSASMSDANSWCQEIGSIFLYWAELWLHLSKVVSHVPSLLLRPLMGRTSCLQNSQQVVKQFEVVSDMKYFHLFFRWFQALPSLFWFTHTSPWICTAGEKKKVLQKLNSKHIIVSCQHKPVLTCGWGQCSSILTQEANIDQGKNQDKYSPYGTMHLSIS